MKRKLISTAIILSTLVGLTACSNESVSTDSGSSETTNSSTPSSKNSASSTPNLTNSVSSDTPIFTEPVSSDTSSSVLQVENWEDFIGADGKPVTLDGAFLDEDGGVAFNYSFMSYAKPIYDDTFKNPELINWETLEFAPGGENYTPTGIRVKAGDILENGLKVTQADYSLAYEERMDEATGQVVYEWGTSYGTLNFEGELTLSGTLYCMPVDDYMAFEGELYFYPDTKSFAQLPVACEFTPKEKRTIEAVYPDAKFAVRCGAMYNLGNINDGDYSGIIEKGEAAAVTVTIKSISIISSNLNHGGRGSACYADIVSIEKINN